MAAGLFTIGCFGPLIAIYVRDTLHASARLFGFVSGMVGVGLLVGTQALRRCANQWPTTRWCCPGSPGSASACCCSAPCRAARRRWRPTFIIGFAFSAIMVPAQTLLQRETPQAMIGRVSSTNISVAFLGQIIGLALSGVLANLFGVRAVFFLCAALAVALAAGGRMFLRSNHQQPRRSVRLQPDRDPLPPDRQRSA